MLSCGLLTAVLLCRAYLVVRTDVCQHFAEGMSSEVMWVVQEAKKELKVYERLVKAAKAEKVTINMAVGDAECLPSAQSLLWVMTRGLEQCSCVNFASHGGDLCATVLTNFGVMLAVVVFILQQHTDAVYARTHRYATRMHTN